MSAIPYKHYPLDPPDTAWDANAEITNASIDDLKVICAWDDATKPEQKNAYKLPHHSADTYHTNLKGLIAAGNAIMGARGGVEIPKYDLDAVKAHLQKHYHEFGRTAPWESKSEWRWYQTKNTGGKLKDVDTTGRTVCGYFASFNTKDSDGDMFAPGCFAKSISENRDRIMHLLQHNTLQPIGRPSTLKEDNQGLYFETPVANTQLGDDVLQLYRDGVYKEHSVGFEMINSQQLSVVSQQSSEEPVNVIKEAKLWEGSTVTWGANSNTPLTGIKSKYPISNIEFPMSKSNFSIPNTNYSLLTSQNILDEALERSTLIYKQLHRGNLHDDTYTLLEIEMKQLQALLAARPCDHTLPASDTVEILKSISTMLKQ
ncbi:MAG TPA: HK97 family phage prohead protease [Bacteroidia bacterium]|jgi:HK97 family phage prohead protease|nr:HK97 family phage prohead protease [Bacteroidia bacterium]